MVENQRGHQCIRGKCRLIRRTQFARDASTHHSSNEWNRVILDPVHPVVVALVAKATNRVGKRRRRKRLRRLVTDPQRGGTFFTDDSLEVLPHLGGENMLLGELVFS